MAHHYVSELPRRNYIKDPFKGLPDRGKGSKIFWDEILNIALEKGVAAAMNDRKNQPLIVPDTELQMRARIRELDILGYDLQTPADRAEYSRINRALEENDKHVTAMDEKAQKLLQAPQEGREGLCHGGSIPAS